ncbi:MAG: DNA-binding protein [Variovorax sp.]|nr:DNA-binding protein [Variovorax sp.]
MGPITEFRGRGIQESDVFTAADALIAEGQRPTIERVRLKIGRGSPNTVSPMLDKWFASLGERLVGNAANAGQPGRNDPDSLPLGVRNAAKLLWETAQREAESVQRRELSAAREDQALREAALVEAQAALMQREDAFALARASLDAALVASQQAREGLERQVQEQAIEGQRLRGVLEREVQRLNTLLAQAAEGQERLRAEHAGVLAARDKDLRQAEERHASHERRMLAEVDRARQAAKALEDDLAKEQQKRAKSEAAAAARLEADLAKLQEVRDAARRTEVDFKEKLAEMNVLAAQQLAEIGAVRSQVVAAQQAIADERAAHEGTRRLLSEALASASRVAEAQSKRAKRAPKAFSP